MTSKTIFGATVLALVAVAAAAPPAQARKKSYRHPPVPPYASAPRPYVEAREPFSFYPENIEGGVRGNLPFNNQIRKFKDPLNAFGAGG